jgi:hypothetical protein
MATPDKLAAKTRTSVAAQASSYLKFAPPPAARAAAPADDAAAPKAAAGKAKAKAAKAPAAPKPGNQRQSMGAGFARCTITAAEVMHRPKDLASLLRPSGYWVHLVTRPGENTGCAICQCGMDPKVQNVVGMMFGDLGKQIEDAAYWLDEHDDIDDDIVRLVHFPEFQVYALGVLRKTGPKAVLVSAPWDDKALTKHREYDLDRFMDLLCDAIGVKKTA